MMQAVLFWFFVFSCFSCHYYQLEKELNPEDAEFINKVRYIITPRERKVFLNLPDSERKAFQQDFWKKRDPNPKTDENEFKQTYFSRIYRANELFVGEGRPGWATDRGRIYILYGAPSQRLTRSHSTMSQRCREIWYYRNFPVVFEDDFCIGQFKLITFDLTSIRHLNIKHKKELSLSSSQISRVRKDENVFLDFNWKIKDLIFQPSEIKGIIEVHIPYAHLWFQEDQNTLRTIIHVKVEIIASNDQCLWKYEHPFRIKTDEESLLKNKNRNHRIEIPFSILQKDNIRLFREGENRVFATLTNQTSGNKTTKILKIKL
ncbi:MAG: GWxTD domain-containing protein [Candidatus Aminicenantes bacterium]|nr:GWxTD domain-containing protein [Candidatus Aminicenantes bacterium]